MNVNDLGFEGFKWNMFNFGSFQRGLLLLKDVIVLIFISAYLTFVWRLNHLQNNVGYLGLSLIL